MKTIPVLINLLAGMLVIVMAGCGGNTPKTIRIYGSTTIEPFMRKAVREYDNKGRIQFKIEALGSNAGIDSLIAGSCDLAMSSTELSLEQIARAKQQGISLKPFLLGYDVVVPIVHPSITVTTLSLAQLVDIYKGTIRNWSVLGGADTVIDLVDRARSSGTYDIWHHNIVPELQPGSNVTICQSNSAVIAYVASHVNAIGYISATYLNPEVRPLKLDGIAITDDDALLAKYHLKHPLYLYVNEAKLGVDLKSLIMFCIIDERGRKILTESGYYTSFTLAPLDKTAEMLSGR